MTKTVRPTARYSTAAVSAARGRAARSNSPRSEHGAWSPSPDRTPASVTLAAQAETRVPELIPIRHGRMLSSPFAFFRGGAAIMAGDLAGVPRTGLEVQLCGDAHLSNFGGFAAPDRRLVFSINDFDETLPGPFEWDVKRLVASFAVAGRQRGIADAKRRAIVMAAAASYRRAMRSFAEMTTLDVWYTRLDIDEILRRFKGAHAEQRRALRRATDKAMARDGLKAMAKLMRSVDGRLEFISDPPIMTRLEDLVGDAVAARTKADAGRLLQSYASSLTDERRVLFERYRFVDIARKVVGVGSVGTRAWVVLMLGRDERDVLLLQFKEAQQSVLEPYLAPSRYPHHGQRVVAGQRLMQAASDIMLGWQRAPGFDGVASRDFFVRQLWDKKGSADVELMLPRGLMLYADLCGWTLARAHARSGDRVALAAYLGGSESFDRAMVDFAEAYADQNERDHADLQRAVVDGRLAAVVGI